MAGYANPYILRPYPELGDRVSVLLRNPQLLPPSVITPRDVPMDDKGQPVDSADAQMAMYEVMARVIVKWRVFDGSTAAPDVPDLDLDIDADALAEQIEALGATEQPPLGDITADNVARLPMAIISDLMDVIGRVASDPK